MSLNDVIQVMTFSLSRYRYPVLNLTEKRKSLHFVRQLFHSMLQDPNPLIRALAVRTMGCIRVDKITEYLCEPLRKCLKVPVDGILQNQVLVNATLLLSIPSVCLIDGLLVTRSHYVVFIYKLPPTLLFLRGAAISSTKNTKK